MTRLRLTAVICNHNHGRFVAQAIDAMASQSRPPDELIIIDDGSNDNSVAIIEPFARRHGFINFVKNERNLGFNASIERAQALATGDFLFSGGADDFVLPGFFEQAMAMAEKHPHAGLIAGKWMHVDEAGRPVPNGIVEVSAWRDPDFIGPERYLREYLLAYPPLHTSSLATIYNVKCLNEVGGFRRELGYFGDTFAIRAIALRHGCCYLPEVFSCWRHVDSSWSRSVGRDPRARLDIAARAVWLMRHSQLKDRFPEEYIARWERESRAFVLEEASRYLASTHTHFHNFAFANLPHASRFVRAAAWIASRWSLVAAWLARRVLWRDVAAYRGDVSCFSTARDPQQPA